LSCISVAFCPYVITYQQARTGRSHWTESWRKLRNTRRAENLSISLYLKETGPSPFPPFSSPVDYFALPEHCTKPATYRSNGIMKALAEMAFQKQGKVNFIYLLLRA